MKINSGGQKKEMTQLMNAVKLFGVEQELFNTLTAFTDPPNPSVKQCTANIESYYSNGFCQTWWSYQFIFEKIYGLVSKPIRAKLLVEQRIIDYLRHTTDDSIRPLLAGGDFSGHAQMKTDIPIAREINDVTIESLKISRGTSATVIKNKMTYAVWQAWILDILNAISKYGYDPDLHNPGDHASNECGMNSMPHEKNQFYFWYLG